jgi:hypothetical protein
MTIFEAINAVVLLIGIPTIAVALIQIGKQIQLIDMIKKDLEGFVKPIVLNLKSQADVLEEKVKILWEKVIS